LIHLTQLIWLPRSADPFFQEEQEKRGQGGGRRCGTGCEQFNEGRPPPERRLAQAELPHQRLIPSLFTKRAGKGGLPLFPKLKAGEICITWIGHASFLVQTKDVNVLIDPNWSMWLKVVKRLKKPGFDLFHLPDIDFVLVTHAHFDHLDRARSAKSRPISRSSSRQVSAISCTISGSTLSTSSTNISGWNSGRFACR
jgi:hypothetical protein